MPHKKMSGKLKGLSQRGRSWLPITQTQGVCHAQRHGDEVAKTQSYRSKNRKGEKGGRWMKSGVFLPL